METTMRIREIVATEALNDIRIQPSAVSQQARVAGVIKNIAASDAQKPATEMDKVLAMMTYKKQQKAVDKRYAQQLKQQAVIANRLTSV